MKIAFSTLGCPDFDWNEVCAMAKDLGFSGIELRGLGGNLFSLKGNVFSDGEIQNTIHDLKKRNLEIPCILCYNDYATHLNNSTFKGVL